MTYLILGLFLLMVSLIFIAFIHDSPSVGLVGIIMAVCAFILICFGTVSRNKEYVQNIDTKYAKAQEDGYTFYLNGEVIEPDETLDYEKYAVAYDDNRHEVYLEERT